MTPSPQVTEIPLPAYDNNSGILTVVGGHYRAYLGGTWFRISSKTYTPRGSPIQRGKTVEVNLGCLPFIKPHT